jgi:hypothetical protein
MEFQLDLTHLKCVFFSLVEDEPTDEVVPNKRRKIKVCTFIQFTQLLYMNGKKRGEGIMIV